MSRLLRIAWRANRIWRVTSDHLNCGPAAPTGHELINSSSAPNDLAIEFSNFALGHRGIKNINCEDCRNGHKSFEEKDGLAFGACN